MKRTTIFGIWNAIGAALTFLLIFTDRTEIQLATFLIGWQLIFISFGIADFIDEWMEEK